MDQGRPAKLGRAHQCLIVAVVAGAVIIAAIGFAGSYAAVRELAERKGFGAFAAYFPLGIDCGIVSLLSLDLLLTWIRIPFPLLRQTAWLLTFATIAFNAATAWPDPLGVGMHATIPLLWVVAVEAGRHAIGRIAAITADQHMEGVRYVRWLLAPAATAVMWRRMKVWEVRSYRTALRLEQDRLIYRARLRARYGWRWRSKAPGEALMPLRMARYGVPLARTQQDSLVAAGLGALPVDQAADRPTPVADQATAAADLPTPVADPVADESTEAPEAAGRGEGQVPGGPCALPAVVSAPLPPADREEPEPHQAVSVEPPVGTRGGPAAPPAPAESGSDVPLQPARPTAPRPAAAVPAQRGHVDAVMQPCEEVAKEPADERVLQVERIVDWLFEEGKISGAEVARRLKVPPRTGLRLLRRAESAYEEQRQDARSQIHAVSG